MRNLRYRRFGNYLKQKRLINFICFCLVLLIGCGGVEKAQNEKVRRSNAVLEPIVRFSDATLSAPKPEPQRRAPYPWEMALTGNHLRITKDYFRCRGSARRPEIRIDNETLFDCSGSHSLPLKDDKEFIWPTLIDMLNHLQETTKKRVIITCGHRCPAHNRYADASVYNQASKHQIGAEVDFYIEGMENEPMAVIDLLLDYFGPQDFKRYEKGGLNVRTAPWFNREVFIKLYEADEGRDLDNNHNYPYVSVQMRYDIERQEWISYTWEKAFKSYLRE